MVKVGKVENSSVQLLLRTLGTELSGSENLVKPVSNIERSQRRNLLSVSTILRRDVRWGVTVVQFRLVTGFSCALSHGTVVTPVLLPNKEYPHTHLKRIKSLESFMYVVKL